jgi:hypothetical protein
MTDQVSASTMNATASRYNGHIVVCLSAPAPAAPEAAPTHIGLLIDTSGSMSGTRIDSVKRTLAAARPLLRETDTVSLVTFDDVGNTQLARQRLDNEGIERFYTTVNNLVPNGSTNLSAGLEKLYEIGTDYTTLLLLTDGHINKGVTSMAGLKAMALGACRSAINTLGYGPDHSRSLLSQLAIASRGSYTYADSDEVLPIIVGDILAGVRGEVFRQVEVSCPAVAVAAGAGAPLAVCQEIDSGGGSYTVGNMVADRDYWAVFRVEGAAASSDLSTIQVSAAGGFSQSVAITESDDPAIQEQIYRCRVARELSSVSELLDGSVSDAARIDTIRNALTSLRTEIAALPEVVRGRPLLLRMMGQIAEALEGLDSLSVAAAAPMAGRWPAGLGRQPAGQHLAARMSSGVTCLATQRGYMSQQRGNPSGGGGGGTGSAGGAGDPGETCLFSSPSQRTGSRAVHATYSQSGAPEPAAAPSVLSPVAEAALPGSSASLTREAAGLFEPSRPPIAPLMRSPACSGVSDP